MPVPGPGYSITIRVEAPPSASAAGDLASAIGKVGGVITAFDVVESHTDRIVVDITCNAMSAGHAKDITAALETLAGGAARDGGQGRAVQEVRRRGRLAGLPGHPGHRGDHPDRAAACPGLRRDQPGGHRRTALLRDRGAVA